MLYKKKMIANKTMIPVMSLPFIMHIISNAINTFYVGFLVT
jgi:hypothetical protein